MFLLLGVATAAFYLLQKQKPLAERQAPTFTNHPHGTPVIGIIGDSWVVRHNLAKLLDDSFNEKKIAVTVISKGHPGATSGEIYSDLFRDLDDPYYSGFVLKQNPDYCIINAGVNDAARHISPETYAAHLAYIINIMLRNHIKPVVVVLPPINLSADEYDKNIFARTGNSISDEVFFGRQLSVADYKKSFLKMYQWRKLKDKIITIDFAQNCNGDKDCDGLFADALHLNGLGYRRFAAQICDAIAKDMKQKRLRE